MKNDLIKMLSLLSNAMNGVSVKRTLTLISKEWLPLPLSPSTQRALVDILDVALPLKILLNTTLQSSLSN